MPQRAAPPQQLPVPRRSYRGQAEIPKKDTKSAEHPEVQLPALTESHGQPDAAQLSEPPPEVVIPPAPEAAAAEPAAAEFAQEPTESVAAEPEPAAPAEAKGKAKKAPKEAKVKQVSALDAAAKVLAESGEAMTTQAMIQAMAAKGYWSSPGGQTPAATLYSAILRELSAKGEQARFVKTEPGKFTVKTKQ